MSEVPLRGKKAGSLTRNWAGPKPWFQDPTTPPRCPHPPPDFVKSLRSSYTGLYPQTPPLQKSSARPAKRGVAPAPPRHLCLVVLLWSCLGVVSWIPLGVLSRSCLGVLRLSCLGVVSWSPLGVLRTRYTLEPLAWHCSHWPGVMSWLDGGAG